MKTKLLPLAFVLAIAAPAAALAQDDDFYPAPIPPKEPVVDPATLDDPLLVHGWEVFDRWCAVCHGQGRGMPGTDSLRLKYDGALPALLEERTDLSPEAVALFVRNGSGPMAPFRKTEVTDEELAAIGAYLARNME